MPEKVEGRGGIVGLLSLMLNIVDSCSLQTLNMNY